MKEEIRRAWRDNTFITCESFHIDIEGDRPWVPYETYMEAQLIDCVPGQIGQLLVRFPANLSEDNRLHVHPISDRVIHVIDGGGTFEFYRKSQGHVHVPLVPGMCVKMPRGVLHTFRSGENGLLVHSLHNPWVPFDDPRCLRYPR